jgi:hypothetical protein
MHELVSALAENGFAKDGRATLNSVAANTMQDGQYSLGARENAAVLMKYTAQYGHLTVAEIKIKCV